MFLEVRTLQAVALATCLTVPVAAEDAQTPGPATGQTAEATSPTTATLAEPSTAWHLYGGFGLGAADGKYGDVLQKPVQWEVRIAKQSPSGAWRFGVGLQFGSMDPADDPNIPPEIEGSVARPRQGVGPPRDVLQRHARLQARRELPPLSPGPRGDRAHPPAERALL